MVGTISGENGLLQPKSQPRPEIRLKNLVDLLILTEVGLWLKFSGNLIYYFVNEPIHSRNFKFLDDTAGFCNAN